MAEHDDEAPTPEAPDTPATPAEAPPASPDEGAVSSAAEADVESLINEFKAATARPEPATEGEQPEQPQSDDADQLVPGNEPPPDFAPLSSTSCVRSATKPGRRWTSSAPHSRKMPTFLMLLQELLQKSAKKR